VLAPLLPIRHLHGAETGQWVAQIQNKYLVIMYHFKTSFSTLQLLQLYKMYEVIQKGFFLIVWTIQRIMKKTHSV